MSLASRPVPMGLGVSQRPTAVRQAGYAEEITNALISPTLGVSKRPGMPWLGDLPATAEFIHTIDRGDGERYVLTIGASTGLDSLTVHDENGVAKVVNVQVGDTSSLIDSYLTSSDPISDFRAVTILDYTFILHTRQTVVSTVTTSPGPLTGTKQKFTDLASVTPALNDIYEIAGDLGIAADNYYVKWDGATWRECPKPGLLIEINKYSMPLQLRREADGTFTIGTITWNQRVAGDENTMPKPSFIGKKITSIFLWRNRLGFTADEKVILSRANDYFNFWGKSVLNPVDSDPVDVSISHSQVSKIRHAIPFQRVMVLLSDKTQFILTAQDAVTPSTVSITPATQLEISTGCPPAAMGSNLYLPVATTTHTVVHEYSVSQAGVRYDTQDLTAEVPKFLPGAPNLMVAYTPRDLLLVNTTGDPSAIYVCRMGWNGDQRTLLSWSRWTTPFALGVKGMATMGTHLFIVGKDSAGTRLVKMSLSDDQTNAATGTEVHLDQWYSSTGTYDSLNNLTFWFIPGGGVKDGDAQGVLGTAFGVKAGVVLTPTVSDFGHTVWVTGNYTSGPVVWGKPITFTYTFSPQYMRDSEGLPMLHTPLKLKNFGVHFSNSGPFEARVTPQYRDQYTYKYAGPGLGDPRYTIGGPTVPTAGTFSFPVQSDGATATIQLYAKNPHPLSFQAAEWEGTYSLRSQRLGK